MAESSSLASSTTASASEAGKSSVSSLNSDSPMTPISLLDRLRSAQHSDISRLKRKVRMNPPGTASRQTTEHDAFLV